MGSRPPRQQPLPKKPRLAAPQGDQDPGVSMSTVTPMIGIATFPIAFGASAVAYIASGSPIAVLVAILATLALGAITWILIRAKSAWRASLEPDNMVVLAMLVGGIGTAFLVGGVAALSLPAIVLGIVVLGGAWLIFRSA